MIFQAENIADSTGSPIDSIFGSPAERPPVFAYEEVSPSPRSSIAKDISSDHVPDWIFYFSIGFLAILAWFRLIYTRFIDNIFRASVNYQLALKVFNEPGIVQRRIFFFLNLFYFFSTAIFLYLVFDHFELRPSNLRPFEFLLIIVGILVAYFLYRSLVMHLTATLFNRKKLFSEALFHNQLYNKICGMVLIPFILLISYTQGIYQEISVYSGLAVFTALNVLRFIRLIIFISKSVLLLFYFILYLCVLEIIPVLVIIKLIFSLLKGL